LHRHVAPGIHAFIDDHVEVARNDAFAPVRIARSHDFIHRPTPVDKVLLRNPMRLEQRFDGEVHAIVGRNGHVHRRPLLDQFFHRAHPELG